ncbi:hypothetical protein SBOR_8997 [Sclerotinia borealis F-4128]|uniref:Uncharacterized protein n=1 Tax=Sclerotinia borealis (strain F-4128) TaxID=1432307 RepID=W9C6U7_SCLBF|nr:hypothetical protein SBOR_8997 [Sclerotinia borealis F-4128]
MFMKPYDQIVVHDINRNNRNRNDKGTNDEQTQKQLARMIAPSLISGEVTMLSALTFPPTIPYSFGTLAQAKARKMELIYNWQYRELLTQIRVISNRATIVLGNEELTNGQSIITQRNSCISFGKLGYSLEYAVADEDKYQQQLKMFFHNSLNRNPPPPDLSATPSPWDTTLGNWIMKGTVGKGTNQPHSMHVMTDASTL